MLPLAITGISALVQAGYGAYRGIKAQKGLDALAKQRKARFMDAAAPIQQNRQFGLQQMKQGIDPSSRAIAQQSAAAQSAAQYRQATDVGGGGMGSAIGRIGALNTSQLGLGLAQQNQAARERGMGMAMSANQQLSSLQQRDISNDIEQRLRQEQAYGQAKQQGFQDVLGAVSGFGSAAMQMSEAEKERQMYRDINGLGTEVETTDGNFPSGGSGPNYLGFKPSLKSQSTLPMTMGGMGGFSKRFTTPKGLYQ
jgi:hypothetical protein